MNLSSGVMLACGGFLLAVLWMDLMFDVQVRGMRRDDVPGPVLDSIAGYYHRATTTSQPMGRLIAVVMVILLAALAVRALGGHDPGWLLMASAVLAGVPVVLAAVRTVPAAVRLGRQDDDVAARSRLARSIYRDHLMCFACLATFLVLWGLRLAGVW